MSAKTKVIIVSYTITVFSFFSFVGIFINAERPSVIPAFIEWVSLPGVLIAVYCMTGPHSDHFIFASMLASISVYLFVPYFVWSLFLRCKRRRPHQSEGNS